VLYAPPWFIEKNPRTVQALVNALVRGLRWVAAHSPEDIADAMPEEYALGDKALYVEAIRRSRAMYSPDGHFTREGADTAARVLQRFDAAVQGAKIDVEATYSDRFVEKVPAK
jgi:NitT/TauT family transport system substrate-binding protein